MSDEKKPFATLTPGWHNDITLSNGERVGLAIETEHGTNFLCDMLNKAVEQREAKLRGALKQVLQAIRSTIPSPELALGWEALERMVEGVLAGIGPDYVPAAELAAEREKVKQLQAVVDLADLHEPASTKLLRDFLVANGFKEPEKERLDVSKPLWLRLGPKPPREYRAHRIDSHPSGIATITLVPTNWSGSEAVLANDLERHGMPVDIDIGDDGRARARPQTATALADLTSRVVQQHHAAVDRAALHLDELDGGVDIVIHQNASGSPEMRSTVRVRGTNMLSIWTRRVGDSFMTQTMNHEPERRDLYPWDDVGQRLVVASVRPPPPGPPDPPPAPPGRKHG